MKAKDGGAVENEKLKKIFESKFAGLIIANLSVAAACAMLYAAGRLRPEFIEKIYRPFSRFVLYWLARALSFVPFSAAEILLYLAIAAGLVAVIRLIYVMVTGPRRLIYLSRFALWAVLIAEIFGLVFYVLWGLNYSTEPLSATLALDVKARSKDELIALNEYLVEKANYYSGLISRGEDGYPEERGFAELAKEVAKRFGEYTGRKELPAKYIIASKFLSYTQITGIFIPYTGEANVNSNNVSSDLPFCMAHEMSHRYAIAPEDEVNFFAFYILYNSDDPYLAYSAYLAAIRYCQNALYYTDYGEFVKIYREYGTNMRNDLMQYADHWDKYEGDIAEISNSVNNRYLKLQGEKDGVKSYDRMVDLMLAWYQEIAAE
jgi:hypothetical protein